MLNIPRIIAGLLLSIAIGGLAYRRRSLSVSGWVGAAISGTLTFGFGGWVWGMTLIVFFVTSSALSHYRQAQKSRLAGEKFEKGGRRDLAQVLANGGAAALLALLYGLLGEPQALLAIGAGVLATVTADTWATELGVLSPHQPRMITSWRLVEPGTSGGVTIHGLLASTAGALIIGLALLALAGIERGEWLLWLVPAALLGGVAGSLCDSLLGATLQAIYRAPGGGETERRASDGQRRNPRVRGLGWMNNDMVNALSSLAGGAVALGVFWMSVEF